MKILSALGILLGISGACFATTSGPWMNVMTFGALGDGAADDSKAIAAALSAAHAATPAGSVFFPAGTYRYNGNMRVDGISVLGAGQDKTFLKAISLRFSSWTITGKSPTLSDFSISAEQTPTSRDTRAEATALNVIQSSGFTIRRVTVGQVSSAGIIVRQSYGTASNFASITDCFVSQTKADGIHVTDGSYDVDVSNNTVELTGDDFISVVSPRTGGICNNIHIGGNTVLNQNNGRGITVVGGSTVTIENNLIDHAGGAGIYLASEGTYDTYGTDTIIVRNNLITSANSVQPVTQGGIHLVGRLVSGVTYPVKNVQITNNRIQGTGRSGIAILSYVSGVTLSGNQIDGAKTDAFMIGPKVTDISLTSGSDNLSPNVVKSCGEYGVHVDPTSCSGGLTISGLLLQAINTSALGYIDGINIGKGTFSTISITHNRLELPAGSKIERLIETQSVPTTVTDNTGNVTISNSIAKG